MGGSPFARAKNGGRKMNIVFDRVSKSYGEKTILSSLSRAFSFSGVTALMGASGCGKTTFLRLLCGLEQPDSGRISGIPERFTFLFQENRLLPWISVLENVRLACPQHPQRAVDALSAVGLAAEQAALPRSLSGGMQRRVAFARALAHESPFLLLDEPFQGQDAALRDELCLLLTEESKKRPVLFVTHDADSAKATGAELLIFDNF